MLGYGMHQFQGEEASTQMAGSCSSPDTVYKVALAISSRMLSGSSELHCILQKTQVLRQLL